MATTSDADMITSLATDNSDTLTTTMVVNEIKRRDRSMEFDVVEVNYKAMNDKMIREVAEDFSTAAQTGYTLALTSSLAWQLSTDSVRARAWKSEIFLELENALARYVLHLRNAPDLEKLVTLSSMVSQALWQENGLSIVERDIISRFMNYSCTFWAAIIRMISGEINIIRLKSVFYRLIKSVNTVGDLNAIANILENWSVVNPGNFSNRRVSIPTIATSKEVAEMIEKKEIIAASDLEDMNYCRVFKRFIEKVRRHVASAEEATDELAMLATYDCLMIYDELRSATELSETFKDKEEALYRLVFTTAEVADLLAMRDMIADIIDSIADSCWLEDKEIRLLRIALYTTLTFRIAFQNVASSGIGRDKLVVATVETMEEFAGTSDILVFFSNLEA
jgi:hypothetical protein